MPSYARRHQLQQSLVYHVFNRSSNRQVIFSQPEDFQHFKALLRDYAKRFSAKLYHWVIMSNHYHLVIELAIPEQISKLMAGLHRAYSHFYHHSYGATGFLWQGRFKLQQPIQKERYLKGCGRYVERNPVRAGMVTEAHLYNHSSAGYYCLGLNDGLTEVDPTFYDFGRDKAERCIQYQEFLRNFDSEEERHFSNFDSPCGDKAFIARLIKTEGRFLPRRKGRKLETFLL